MKHILLIEDNPGMTLALKQALIKSYQLHAQASGEAGIDAAKGGCFDCILLDLNLPDMSGLEVCQRLRANGCKIPIIVLTAEHQVLTKIKLLDAGADDYITKPFSLGELKARIRAAQRAAGSVMPANDLTIGDLQLNVQQHSVKRAGQVIRLRRKEFALLECLMQRAGTVVTRDIIGDHVWGDEVPWAGTIDVHVKYLRDKVDRPFDQALIQTVHGVGYRINPSSDGLVSRHELTDTA